MPSKDDKIDNHEKKAVSKETKREIVPLRSAP